MDVVTRRSRRARREGWRAYQERGGPLGVLQIATKTLQNAKFL